MNLSGILQNPNLERDIQFASTAELLFTMDELFDQINAPQRTMLPRSFDLASSRCPPESKSPPSASCNPVATFKIEVLFRQNASWQGTVVLLDKKEEAQFRSVLELLFIIDSAIKSV